MPVIVSNAPSPVATSPGRDPVGVVEPDPWPPTRSRAQHERIDEPVRAFWRDRDSSCAELDNRSRRHLELGAIKLQKKIEFARIHTST